ncbi:MAG: peptidylprolyl isomerase, partial [Actinobacteria bacterium]|nr:peptidylprolyl isomerase [Actinomycetota bacterium]
KLSHILIKFSAEDEKTGSNQEGEGTQKESSKTSTSNTLTREEALEKMEYIESELKNGARFEDLAKKYSDDKISAANGGDIGYVSKSELIKELGDVAFSLNVGEVSDIVETPYGFYILKVTDRKKEYIKDFEEVKDSIEYYLESVEKSKKWEEFIYSLMDKADIKYYIEGATSSTTETGTGTTDTGADVESKGGKTQGQNQE